MAIEALRKAQTFNCDVCGEDKPVSEKHHGYPYGLETTWCDACGESDLVKNKPVPVDRDERQRAIKLANKVLDRPSGDPDDDLAVLSRQLLRAIDGTIERCAQIADAWTNSKSCVEGEPCEHIRLAYEIAQRIRALKGEEPCHFCAKPIPYKAERRFDELGRAFHVDCMEWTGKGDEDALR